MDTKIYAHDNEVDLYQKNNYVELQTWMTLLKLTAKELESFVWLGERKSFKSEVLIHKLTDKKAETSVLLDLLGKYLNQITEIRECEDMDCEYYYQHQHEQLRVLFNYHIEQCSKLKCKLLNSIEAI
ncbi:hypothetical protein ACFSYG_04375 [Leeuwenhoekiella polynyae]|uniref:Uncharacterized protein n=1 Tax=Leeuwenhoekiella polynyae TaxID=1550906 RepID=A0A4Q0P4D5_9FLAO|nr:hypothetical protein [Leeuwenhoekiella polynyae]RXG20948.1 hypothetical protein DSM02_2319 [Leeuwenhoekiella polynyae]